MNNIKITIKGGPNSGKNTIMAIVQEALQAKGINVKVDPSMDFNYDENLFNRFKTRHRTEKIDAIKSKDTLISLSTVQLTRTELHKMVKTEIAKTQSEKIAEDFTRETLSTINSLLSEDYKIGFKEGIERFLENSAMKQKNKSSV